MKLIIPAAGKGTRMRPLTHSVAKPLIPVAGKPCIQHIIDTVLETQGVEVTGIVLIVGHLKDQLVEWAKEQYDIPVHVAEQKAQNGTAHAIKLAEPFVKNEEALILFSDTLFDADLEVITEDKEADNIIWCAEVEDPRRFGVVVEDEDHWMTDIEEKPDNPRSNLANIGMYYVRDTRSMFSIIDAMFEEEMKHKGEYFFTTTLEIMMNNGKKTRVYPVEGWYDTGIHKTTLETNKIMCKRIGEENSIHPTAVIERSTLFNCIVMESARITDCDLENSIVGPRGIVKHTKGQVIVGADAIVDGNDNRD